MSEQEKPKSSFMQELHQWTESNIISPLYAIEAGEEDWDLFVERIKN